MYICIYFYLLITLSCRTQNKLVLKTETSFSVNTANDKVILNIHLYEHQRPTSSNLYTSNWVCLISAVTQLMSYKHLFDM